MLNRRLIVVNGFARGGTNLLANMLQSHPDVCVPAGETHRVFQHGIPGLRRWRLLLLWDLPIRKGHRQDVFGPGLYRRRKPVPRWCSAWIDTAFFVEKLFARDVAHNLLKAEDVRYTTVEIARSRTLLKSLHATLYATEILDRMYPDAVFFGLVRNGLAICEGQVRRGRTAEWAARRYQVLVSRMLRYADTMRNFHLVRFEEILADPRGILERVYGLAGLDPARLEKVRFQVKATLTRDGEHRLEGGRDRQVVWYDVADMGAHLKPGVDEIQIARLRDSDRHRFLAVAGDAMRRLGYVS